MADRSVCRTFLTGIAMGALFTYGLVYTPETGAEPPDNDTGLPSVPMSPADMFCAQQGTPLQNLVPPAATSYQKYNSFNETNAPNNDTSQFVTFWPSASRMVAKPILFRNSYWEYVAIPLNCATYYIDVVCLNLGYHEWSECMILFYWQGNCEEWLEAILPGRTDGRYYFMFQGEDENNTAVTYRTRCMPDRQRKRVVAVDTEVLDSCDAYTRDAVAESFGWAWWYSHWVDLTGYRDDPSFRASPCRYIRNEIT